MTHVSDRLPRWKRSLILFHIVGIDVAGPDFMFLREVDDIVVLATGPKVSLQQTFGTIVDQGVAFFGRIVVWGIGIVDFQAVHQTGICLSFFQESPTGRINAGTNIQQVGIQVVDLGISD